MLVSVAVPVPQLGELTYYVPRGMTPPQVGARVRVPVGPRTLLGCVMAIDGSSEPDTSSLKPIHEVVDADPVVNAEVLALCRWTAEYYLAGIGEAVQLALPPGTQKATRSFRTTRVVALTALGARALELGSQSELTRKQHAALLEIGTSTTGLPVAQARARGISADVLRRLEAHGLIVARSERLERDPFSRAGQMQVPVDEARQLTAEQVRAMEALGPLCDAGRFAVALVHGVTGSGKTELYLRLARRAIASHRQVLLLVPEIALTPSVAAFFASAMGSRVAILHSGLSDGERHDQWYRIHRDEVDVVIGTRSAVFAPLGRLGLVIVDEEHDGSYKQEDAPRYHGRDVAIVRAQAAGAVVVLGSATPSMESYQNAAAGKYTLVELRNRVLDRSMAEVVIVNMREEYAASGPDVMLSRPLEEALGERLARGEQVVVLLNRRGYASAVFCRQCGDTFDCPNCSVSLTMHAGRRRAPEPGTVAGGWGRCHYCNYAMRIPSTCRKCAAPYLEQRGFGTERVEAHLRQRFPQARIGRIDRDSTRKRGSLAQMLGQFASGELDILVGTQMIAKGHDFPRVTLVGVVSADIGLGLADFRAAERTFQLLTQVAGRAGRGVQPGAAVVQTLFPEHYSVQLGCRQAYAEFFAQEIAFRRDMRYPPFVAMMNIIVRGVSLDAAMTAAQAFADRLRPHLTVNVQVLGPAPAPMERLRGEHRVQVFLKGTRRAEMRQAVRAALAASPELRRRISVDVDPLNVI